MRRRFAGRSLSSTQTSRGVVADVRDGRSRTLGHRLAVVLRSRSRAAMPRSVIVDPQRQAQQLPSARRRARGDGATSTSRVARRRARRGRAHRPGASAVPSSSSHDPHRRRVAARTRSAVVARDRRRRRRCGGAARGPSRVGDREHRGPAVERDRPARELARWLARRPARRRTASRRRASRHGRRRDREARRDGRATSSPVIAMSCCAR